MVHNIIGILTPYVTNQGEESIMLSYTGTTIVLLRATATYFHFQITPQSIYYFPRWHRTFDGLGQRLNALKTGRNL